MVCLAGNAGVVSLCGKTRAPDGSSGGRALPQGCLASSSADPESDLQSAPWLDRVPDDCCPGAGCGGSASTPEVAAFFFWASGWAYLLLYSHKCHCSVTAAFNARFVERASGQWPCDYTGAGLVLVRQRTEEVWDGDKARVKEVHHPDADFKPGLLVADAVLSVAEIQNLEEEIGALMKAGVDLFGAEPKFSLRVEIMPKTNAEREKGEEFNRLLGEVSGRLRLL